LAKFSDKVGNAGNGSRVTLRLLYALEFVFCKEQVATSKMAIIATRLVVG
jgi:hypothetical protein